MVKQHKAEQNYTAMHYGNSIEVKPAHSAFSNNESKQIHKNIKAKSTMKH